jgi:hypothetical protein
MQIKQRYEDGGETCREIGTSLGISDQTVLRVLYDLGVQTRPACRRARTA